MPKKPRKEGITSPRPYAALGNEIRRRQKAKGHTQESLAAALTASADGGIHRDTVGAWARGETFPSGSHLQALKRVLGFTDEEILKLTPANQPPDQDKATNPANSTSETRSPLYQHPQPACPYRGLSPFDVRDRPFFFGREKLTDRMLQRLRPAEDPANESRFFAIVGASGSGKSSLARAGLLGTLKDHGHTSAWPQIIITPAAEPLESLAIGVSRCLTPENAAEGALRLLERLGANDRTLHLTFATSNSDKDKRVVVLVDQFEEIFTLTKDESKRRSFISNLLNAAFAPHGSVIVILTMRSDFYGRCGDYPDFAAAMSEHHLLVPAMGPDELSRAIAAPAELLNVSLEGGLCEALVSDVLEQPGSLPLLQHALLELWNLGSGNGLLTHQAYRLIGRVHGALAKRAEDFYNLLTPDEQNACEQIFIRLTELGEETEDTRRRVSANELISGDDRRRHLVSRIIERLSSADIRLITVSADDTGTDVRVEVTHEALIRNWPRLRQWLHENRTAIVEHRKLTAAVNDWARHGHQKAYLYRDSLLASVDAWHAVLSGHLSEAETRFLRESASNEVDSLLHSSLDKLPEDAARIGRLGEYVRARLREIANDPNRDAFARRRSHCALLSAGSVPDEFILGELLTCDVPEFLIILGLLPERSSQCATFFAARASNANNTRESLLRAIIALARFDTDPLQWVDLGRSLAGALLEEPEYSLTLWIKAIRPVRRFLLPPLLGAAGDEALEIRKRGVAAFAVAELYADDPASMAQLLSVCEVQHFDLAFRKALAGQEALSPAILLELGRICSLQTDDKNTPTPVFARSRAASAALLCKHRQWQGVIEYLNRAPSIEYVSQFIHLVRSRTVQMTDICDLLLGINDPKVKAPLILALGEFKLATTSQATQARLLNSLFDWYSSDPSSWVHGSCKWLLRKWGFEQKIDEEDKQLATRTSNTSAEWYVAKLGEFHTTFVIVQPGVYHLGSPSIDSLRQDDEIPVQVHITRAFAIADYQVTRKEFDAYYDSSSAPFTQIEKIAATSGHPMIMATWREAVSFCNWLTLRNGFQETELCYSGVPTTLPEVAQSSCEAFHPERKGFRLPTEAEREIACRAGTRSIFSFGDDATLLPHYGWYLDNSNFRAHKPGQLRPNPWGVFDMHGNTYNWCYDWYGPYQTNGVTDPVGAVSGYGHVLRGGGWNYGPRDARSAHRYFSQENNRNAKIGFRLVHTFYGPIKTPER